MLRPGIRLAFGGLCAPDASQYFFPLLLVQRKRLDSDHDLVCTDRVSLFEINAQHTTRDRGGDDEAIVRSSLPVFINCYAQGAASRIRNLNEMGTGRSKTQASAPTKTASTIRSMFDGFVFVPLHSLVFSTATKSRRRSRRYSNAPVATEARPTIKTEIT